MALDPKDFAGGLLTTYTPSQAMFESIVVRLGQHVQAAPRGQIAAGAVGNMDVKTTWCEPGSNPVTLNQGAETNLLWSLTLLPSATLAVGPIYLPATYERIVDRVALHGWVTAKLLGIGLDHLLRSRLAELPNLEVNETTAAGIAAALVENCDPALWRPAADGDPIGALLLAPNTLKTIRANPGTVEGAELATGQMAGLPIHPFKCGTGLLGVVVARTRLIYRLSDVTLQRLTEAAIEYDRVGFKLLASADVQIVADQAESLAFKIVAREG